MVFLCQGIVAEEVTGSNMNILWPRWMPTWAVACSLDIRSLNLCLWLLFLWSGFQNTLELQYRVPWISCVPASYFTLGLFFSLAITAPVCKSFAEKPEKTQRTSYYNHCLAFYQASVRSTAISGYIDRFSRYLMWTSLEEITAKWDKKYAVIASSSSPAFSLHR